MGGLAGPAICSHLHLAGGWRQLRGGGVEAGAGAGARVRGRTCNNLLGVPTWSPTVMFCVETWRPQQDKCPTYL